MLKVQISHLFGRWHGGQKLIIARKKQFIMVSLFYNILYKFALHINLSKSNSIIGFS